MQVNAVGITLPDLDERVADGFAAGVEHPAADVGDLAHAGRDPVVDDQQVVVGVEREMVRIIRSLGLRRRPGQRLGKGAGGGEEGGGEAGVPEEGAPGLERKQEVHGTESTPIRKGIKPPS